MSQALLGIRAVVFDYGNTLVEFTRRHVDHCDAVLAKELQDTFGGFDALAFKTLRDQNRMAPYRNGFRENTMEQFAEETVAQLFGREATAAEVTRLTEIRFEAFVGCIDAEPETKSVLAKIHDKYRTAVLSNYPCGKSIRASLRRTGLDAGLDSVVVSGEVGWAKPHPLVFQRVTEALGVAPHEVVFVGDNWLADVQGAKRAGMHVVHIRRWAPPEYFEKSPGDVEPDYSIDHLEELRAILGA